MGDNEPRKPLCFVLMPFGRKPSEGGKTIDFDNIYRTLIAPAIEKARMMPIRADMELAGGVIHKPMYERLMLCDYAVADLTDANANVYYELGIRHAVRPASTVPIFAEGFRLPFDLGPVRGLPYELGPDGEPCRVDQDLQNLAGLLEAARQQDTDSPLYQLVNGMRAPDIQHLKTDVFRDEVEYSESVKEQLASARNRGKRGEEAKPLIEAVEEGLGQLHDVASGILVDLLLSYRAVKAWSEMIGLVERMPEPLAQSVMVREQFAFALNRDGNRDKAERVLKQLLKERGPSSETLGILGRVYKDHWEDARRAGRHDAARGLLAEAIDSYVRGFESDWRDAYPGVNAVTLMALAEPPDPRMDELLPVVEYSVRRRIASGEPDYWDYATLLELAVLGRREDEARQALSRSLAAVREVWEPETTLRNLRLIREKREQQGEVSDWMREIESALERAEQSMQP